MSSHHVIREGQEPPVLIMDAVAAENPLLPDLLEWSPVIIALPDAVPAILLQQIKIDILLCSPDDLSRWKQVFRERYPVTLIGMSAGDQLPGVLMGILEKYNSGIIYAFTDSQENTALLSKLEKVVCFIRDQRWSWFRQGNFRKWMRKGDELEIVGEYGDFEGGELIGSNRIRQTEDGIIFIKQLKNAWILEGFT